MPESKEVLTTTERWVYDKETPEPSKRAASGQSWNNMSNRINKAGLDYNPTCKINIHECTFI